MYAQIRNQTLAIVETRFHIVSLIYLLFPSSIDVLQLLYSSALPTTRAVHMTDLLSHHFTTMTTSLKKLGIDLAEEGITFEYYHQQYRNHSWECMMSSIVLLRKFFDVENAGDTSTTGKKDSVAKESSELEKRMQKFTAVRLVGNAELSQRILAVVNEVKAVYQS